MRSRSAANVSFCPDLAKDRKSLLKLLHGAGEVTFIEEHGLRRSVM